MALDFPANPIDGQIFDSYIWSASKGVWLAKPQSATVAIMSSSAPVSANNGDIWFNTATGMSYVYYQDGSSAQWVEFMSPAPENQINSINDINDVEIISPVNGQALTYDQATSTWINSTPASTLDSLTDVTISNPQNTQVLMYENSTSQWKNLTIDISATTISDTAPTGAQQGDAWFDSSSGFLYIFYSDGTGAGQWVEVKANSGDLAALTARVSTLESKADFPIQLNTQTISANYTIPAGYNGMSAGPITISNNVVVTIPDGSSWSIV